jgi:hypothetical protein
LNLKGYFRWVKAYEPEEYSGDTRFITNFYPFDEKEWEKFNKSGLQQTPKEDTDGKKFVRFRRSVRKVFPKDDEATYFTPPEVSGAVNVSYVNAETNEKVKTYKKSDKIELKVVGDKTPIGNDSVGYINLAVYDTNQGKGHRWESMTILDLVEYNPDKPSEPVVQPKVEDKKASKEKKSVKEELNDEIPW